MRRLNFFLWVNIGLTTSAIAQTSYPHGVENSDRAILSMQESGIVENVNPVSEKASDYVVSIQRPTNKGWELVALGTITEKGIVTKLSEVKEYLNGAMVAYSGREAKRLNLIGVYEEYDLALLEDSHNLTAIQMDRSGEVELGDFVLLSGPESVRGFGTVSVKERSLKAEDKAFLGIRMDFNERSQEGVSLASIEPDTGASRAGLKRGDRLLSIDDKKLGSAIQTRSVIMSLKPGQKIKVKILRGEEELTKVVILGGRDKVKKFSAARLSQMEKMGGEVSSVRDEFPSVIQTDMQIRKNNMGGPVLDLEGRFVGVAISRSRIKTHVIPADSLGKLLETEPLRVSSPMAKKNDGQRALSQREKLMLQSLDENDETSQILKELFKNGRIDQDKWLNNKRHQELNNEAVKQRIEKMKRELKFLEGLMNRK